MGLSWLEELPAGLVGELARRMVGLSPPEDVAKWTAAEALGRAQLLLQLLQTEKPIEIVSPNLERDGWHSHHSIIAIAVPDRPFLVDSLRLEIRRTGAQVLLTTNLVAAPDLETQSLSGGAPLALLLIEIDRLDSKARALLKASLCSVMNDLAQVVEDFPAMAAALAEVAADASPSTAEFLTWLGSDHFTFLAYERFHSGALNDALGLSHGREAGLLPDESLDSDDDFVFTKAPLRSRVHRAAYMDLLIIKTGQGAERTEHRFYGLLTSRAYQTQAQDIPLLSEKIGGIVQRQGFSSGGHNEKQLNQILQVFPRDELLQAPEESLERMALSVLALQERPLSRLLLRRDPLGHFASVLLYMPRDRYDTEIRSRIQGMLVEALDADDVEFNTTFSESVHVRVQFILKLASHREVVEDTLNHQVLEAIKSWQDRLFEALVEDCGEADAQRLQQQYAQFFPAGYREDTEPSRALVDLKRLDQLSDSRPLDLSLYRDLSNGQLRLKLYSHGGPVSLSDALPIMEHLGVRVLSDQTYGSRNRDWVIHDFTLSVSAADTLVDWRDDWQEAFLAAWRGLTESDSFHGLVLSARLDWREIALLRGLSAYLKQIGFELSRDWIATTLVNHGDVARLLVELFLARHDPSGEPHAETQVLEKIDDALANIAGLNEDRLVRRYRDVICAIDRTNYFQTLDSEDRPSLAFKIAPRRLDDIPKPVPLHEIFVYSARVEGVHLRGGRIARGGLRWSDRGEDYRTEVLGLVKAQQVKNAVIVPEGAKGGFVAKQLPTGGDRDAFFKEGQAAYKEFIRGLLCLTDNLVDGELVHPPRLRRLDEPDPYLVVAADKGTATFSDIANGIAEEQGFWLGDAFASGGSAGYDHKAMGITAKGAWVSVVQHFRRLGLHPERDTLTAVGIGDMSGDVFGNGLQRSKTLKLVAAFNHLHIFVDPDPDPEAAWHERQRLYETPRSTWADYQGLSKGGAVFDRAAKSLTLSASAAKALGVKPGKRTPNELIREILLAKVDLLWNGGIGTYVKAASETHGQVGDKANDAIRVNGGELGAKVVGEGGNLGLTQLGRVEFALSGGLINTDFIDNSAGVDCSDHEVNLKILLGTREVAGELTRRQRNRMLESMTDEVAELVLHNNDRQASALGLAALQAQQNRYELARFVELLAEQGELDPQLEGLPADLTQRPLTAPELAVLMATSKNRLKRTLVGAHEDQALSLLAEDAFPASLRADFKADIQAHRLQPELVATQLANAMVHFLGIAVTHRLESLAQVDSIAVAKAFQVVRVVYGVDQRWSQLEDLGADIDAKLHADLTTRLAALVRRATRWLLRRHGDQIDVGALVEVYQKPIQALEHGIDDWLYGLPRKHYDTQLETAMAAGVPKDLARFLAATPSLTGGPSVVEAMVSTGQDVERVTGLYLAIGEQLGLHRFARQVNALQVTDHWEARARDGLRDDLDRAYQAFVEVLPGQGAPDDVVRAWLAQHPRAEQGWLQLLDAADQAGSAGYSVMSVAGRTLSLLPYADA